MKNECKHIYKPFYYYLMLLYTLAKWILILYIVCIPVQCLLLVVDLQNNNIKKQQQLKVFRSTGQVQQTEEFIMSNDSQFSRRGR